MDGIFVGEFLGWRDLCRGVWDLCMGVCGWEACARRHRLVDRDPVAPLVCGLGFRDYGCEFKVSGFGFRVSGSGFRV